jgi:hypothetical protein
MRRMTGALAQRILHLSETQHLDDAKIGQRLGLPINTVRRILANRANSSIRVLENAHGVRRKNQNVPSFSNPR